MAYFCRSSVLLMFATYALALPNILSLIQPASTPLVQNPNSNNSAAATIFLQPSSHGANDGIEYRVPNTPITLRFELKQAPIEREQMAQTILPLQVKLRRFIASHHQVANDVLFNSDDPYMSNPFYVGCFFAVTHWPPDRQKRLTYGMVDNVLKGVWEFMYQGERFVCTDFYITDDRLGTVGYGRLLTESPGLNSRNITEA